MLNIFEVTGLYTAIFGVLMVFFTLRVGLYRMNSRISFGDEGDKELLCRMRAHGNFVENVPMGLILLAMVEAAGAADGWLHVIALLLLVGRLSHWLQLSGFIKPLPFRMMGMMLTFISMLTSSVWLLLNL
ncbi:MAPEG family protein [Maricurvus nonylphenolicus]|uniref:MAPEG family protein n=1 Tax=Maricurvus nonylphenolicus TaxID=1008307 RepID=UPI0036F1BB50